jgi:hypothetical protein
MIKEPGARSLVCPQVRARARTLQISSAPRRLLVRMVRRIAERDIRRSALTGNQSALAGDALRIRYQRKAFREETAMAEEHPHGKPSPPLPRPPEPPRHGPKARGEPRHSGKGHGHHPQPRPSHGPPRPYSTRRQLPCCEPAGPWGGVQSREYAPVLVRNRMPPALADSGPAGPTLRSPLTPSRRRRSGVIMVPARSAGTPRSGDRGHETMAKRHIPVEDAANGDKESSASPVSNRPITGNHG